MSMAATRGSFDGAPATGSPPRTSLPNVISKSNRTASIRRLTSLSLMTSTPSYESELSGLIHVCSLAVFSSEDDPGGSICPGGVREPVTEPLSRASPFSACLHDKVSRRAWRRSTRYRSSPVSLKWHTYRNGTTRCLTGRLVRGATSSHATSRVWAFPDVFAGSTAYKHSNLNMIRCCPVLSRLSFTSSSS
jgi:hypothetical protein